MQTQKIDIVVISSVLNSDTLNEWFSLMLRCLADTTKNQVVIVSPYSKEKLDYAIKAFQQSGNFHSFVQIGTEDTSYSDFSKKINRFLYSVSGFNVQRMFSIFSPCQGNKQELTAKVETYLKNVDISSTEIIPFDKYMVEASSILMYQLIKEFVPAKLFHLVLDPQEIDMSILSQGRKVTSIFGHKLPYAESHPFILYEFADKLRSYMYLSMIEFSNIYHSKNLDFVFGLSAFNEERVEIAKKSMYLNDYPKNRFYYYANIDGQVVDTRIPYNEYLGQLDKSLSTLVIPAYDQSTFSIHRFIEALANGCLSIIYMANYPAGFDNDQEVIKLIEKHLWIDDLDKLQDKIKYVEENWFRIFTDFITSNFIQKLMYKDQYTQSLSKIIDQCKKN